MCRATLRTIIVLEPMSERAETEEMLEGSVAMRCLCSYAISVALLDAGDQLCTITFYDGNPTSDTYEERVRECPSCGEQIGLHRLLPSSGQEG